MKKNILLIVMDDLGWADIQCNGSSFYETPNLNRLAAEGQSFSSAYAASPVCSPARASIMTGKYPVRTGITDWIDHGGKMHPLHGLLTDAPYKKFLSLEELSLAKALKSGGYDTWHVGKWHLGSEEYGPEAHGFDVNIGGCHLGHPPQGYFAPWNIPGLHETKEGEYLTDRLTEEAIQLIEKRKTDKPFFLNFWPYAVHTPIQAPAALIKKYEAKQKAMGLDKEVPFQEGEFFPTEDKKNMRVRRRMIQSDPAYAAMIENMDQNIGRLLASLEKEGLSENTAIIFTSDNGGLSTAEGAPTCNSPLSEGKGWVYEGGTRVPFIIKYPEIPDTGKVSSLPVCGTDIYPTVLDLAELPMMPEQHRDGTTILPYISGRKQENNKTIFWHYPHYGNQGGHPGSSILEGNWKLIEFFEDMHIELYDLKSDIGEKINLAEKHPAKAEDLKMKLHKWRKSTDAVLPLKTEKEKHPR